MAALTLLANDKPTEEVLKQRLDKFLAEAVAQTQSARANSMSFALAVVAVWPVLKILGMQHPATRGSFFVQQYIKKYLLPLRTGNYREDEDVRHALCDAYDQLHARYVHELQSGKGETFILRCMSAFVSKHCKDDPSIVYRVGKLLVKANRRYVSDVEADPHYVALVKFLAAFDTCQDPEVYRVVVALVAKTARVMNYRCTDSLAPIIARYLVPMPTPTKPVEPVKDLGDTYYQAVIFHLRRIASSDAANLNNIVLTAKAWFAQNVATCPDHSECIDGMKALGVLVNAEALPEYNDFTTKYKCTYNYIRSAWEVVRVEKINDRYLKFLLGWITRQMQGGNLTQHTMLAIADMIVELGKARISSVDCGFFTNLKTAMDKVTHKAEPIDKLKALLA